MKILPAVDVLDGRVVRLHRGDFDAVTDYGGDPLAAARAFAEDGATTLHLVDLSGARDGARRQTGLVAEIARLGLEVQTGGGVRSAADVEAILDAGAARAVIGSLAVSDPETVAGWVERFGGERIVAAFDVRLEDGEAWPTLKGWTERATRPLDALLDDYRAAGLVRAMATDVDRDGTLEGPNLDLYRDLLANRPDIAWQASGGVSSLDDVKALKAAGLPAVIIGRALFEHKLRLEDALSC